MFYSRFCKCAKRGRKIQKKKEKKTKKLSQFLKSHISGTLKAISLNFGMWSAEVGGSVHSKTRLVSSRQHRATEVRKLHFRSSCQYTHGCCATASWAARHTTVCLDTTGTSALPDIYVQARGPQARVCIYRQNTSARGITNMFYFSM